MRPEDFSAGSVGVLSRTVLAAASPPSRSAEAAASACTRRAASRRCPRPLPGSACRTFPTPAPRPAVGSERNLFRTSGDDTKGWREIMQNCLQRQAFMLNFPNRAQKSSRRSLCRRKRRSAAHRTTPSAAPAARARRPRTSRRARRRAAARRPACADRQEVVCKALDVR